MKARPMLFAGPMVRAEIEGRKTMTRRAMKPQPEATHDGYPYWHIGGYRAWEYMAVSDERRMGTHNPLKCPYGQPGDLLWVREAHSIFDTHGQHRTDGKRWGPWGGLPTQTSPDGTQIAYYREGFDRCDPGRWRPSIHMPRWASRLTLRITDVRVERLQDISEADALAEGITPIEVRQMWLYGATPERRPEIYRAAAVSPFRDLWGSINGPGSWGANPYVWVISFEVIQANVDDVMRGAA